MATRMLLDALSRHLTLLTIHYGSFGFRGWIQFSGLRRVAHSAKYFIGEILANFSLWKLWVAPGCPYRKISQKRINPQTTTSQIRPNNDYDILISLGCAGLSKNVFFLLGCPGLPKSKFSTKLLEYYRMDTTYDYFIRVVYKASMGNPTEAYALWMFQKIIYGE